MSTLYASSHTVGLGRTRVIIFFYIKIWGQYLVPTMVVGAFNNNIKCYELLMYWVLKFICLKILFELNRKFTIVNKMTFLTNIFSKLDVTTYFTLFYLRDLLIKFEQFFSCTLHFFLPPPLFFKRSQILTYLFSIIYYNALPTIQKSWASHEIP